MGSSKEVIQHCFYWNVTWHYLGRQSLTKHYEISQFLLQCSSPPDCVLSLAKFRESQCAWG